MRRNASISTNHITRPAAITFCGVLNVTIERVAYRRLRNAPRLAPLITAIGVSFILQNLGAVFFGFNYRQADSIAFDASTPHEYLNKTGDVVRAIWVVVHSEPGRA